MAAGSGKSHVIRAGAIAVALGAPGSASVIIRKELKALKANHMQGTQGLPAMLDPLVRAGLVKIDNSNNIIRFKNGPGGRYAGGSTISLVHLSRGDASLDAVQGMEISGVLFIDESTHLTAHQINYVKSRVRLGAFRPEKGSTFDGLLPRIIYCTNPGSVSHIWHKNTFTHLEPYKVHPSHSEDGFDRMFIPALCIDNPYIDKNYVQTLRDLEDPQERKALLWGSWDIASGMLFDESLQRRYNTIEEVKLPPNATITKSFDFGASAPSVILYAYICDRAESLEVDGEMRTFPEGTTFVLDEIYMADPEDYTKGINIEDTEIGRRIKEFESAAFPTYNIMQGIADGAVFNRDHNKKTIIEDINKGYYGREQYNEEILFKPYWKPAGSRELGARKLNSMFLATHKENKMEDAGLFFQSRCKYTLLTLETLVRDPAKFDCIKGSCDHAFDALRYLVLNNVQKFETMTASVF